MAYTNLCSSEKLEKFRNNKNINIIRCDFVPELNKYQIIYLTDESFFHNITEKVLKLLYTYYYENQHLYSIKISKNIKDICNINDVIYVSDD